LFSGNREDATEEQITISQDLLLEARAKYQLRNNVIEAVMEATPILRSVHNDTHASPVERDLLAHIEQRDEVTKLVAQSAAEMADIQRQRTEVQSKTLQVRRKNVELAAELLEVTNQLKAKTERNWEGSSRWEELRQVQEQLKASERRLRIIKGVASGIIVGSGVDWAADEELCQIVLDLDDGDEDEDAY
jgi:hypothetical protein